MTPAPDLISPNTRNAFAARGGTGKRRRIMARVELQNVRKTYDGGVEAVKGATLAIEDKEFVVLVGPSGCGKSTTLRMVAGLEDITSGEILIGGRRVNDVPPKDRDIAMVFQNYALYPHMTVYKNMAFGLKLRRYPKADIDRRVRNAASILGIEDLLERRPKALSGGQRQRVAVGRAIVRDPKVFLFDEPLSNLDAKLRVQMRTEISRLHNQLQSTMIYVTHDQVEAMTMGDRIVVMLDGEIQQVATPLELYNRPANRFVATFIGSPPMNVLSGKLVAENGSLFFREDSGVCALRVPSHRATVLEEYAGRPVRAGIRPEDLNENPNQTAHPGVSFAAPVEVVEPMGAETNLYLKVGSETVVARVRPETQPPVGSEYVLDVDCDKVHFFDVETDMAIRQE